MSQLRKHSRTRRRRGTSLIEVIVNVVIMGVIIAGGGGLVVAVSEVAASAAARSAGQSAIAGSSILLDYDLGNASLCEPRGLDTQLVALVEHPVNVEFRGFAFTADVVDGASQRGQDGLVDLVVWRVDGTDLRRAVTAGTPGNDCAWTEPGDSEFVTMLTGVTDYTFAPITEAAVTTPDDPNYMPTCDYNGPDGCGFDAIRVAVEADVAGSGPIGVDQTYPLLEEASRL